MLLEACNMKCLDAVVTEIWDEMLLRFKFRPAAIYEDEIK